jgi:hypothetical protein
MVGFVGLVDMVDLVDKVDLLLAVASVHQLKRMSILLYPNMNSHCIHRMAEYKYL